MRRASAGRPVLPALCLVAAGLVAGATFDFDAPARASSDDAWKEFQQETANLCANAAGLQRPQVRLDPFGTQTYGVARVTGTATDGHWQTVVCVLRKTPDGPVDVEISAPLEDWITVAPAKAP